MDGRTPIYADRREAGRKLGEVLLAHAADDPVVLALPRGGVPVAYEVAQALGAPLDLILVRKLGAPGHPELGLGAVVDGREPQVLVNQHVVQEVAPPPGYLEREAERQMVELERRRRAYLGDRKPLSVRGRTVIVVDDGVATGGTVRAALAALARTGAGQVILAVPVGPQDVLESLRADADAVVCPSVPAPFFAVGLWYEDFTQTEDAEVVELLARAAEPGGRPNDADRAAPSSPP